MTGLFANVKANYLVMCVSISNDLLKLEFGAGP